MLIIKFLHSTNINKKRFRYKLLDVKLDVQYIRSKLKYSTPDNRLAKSFKKSSYIAIILKTHESIDISNISLNRVFLAQYRHTMKEI